MAVEQTEGVVVDSPAEIDLTDHDCPYLNHVEHLLTQAGSDLGNWSMNSLVRARIQALHADGECPPTHPGGPTSPSTEWADHVQMYSSPRSVL